jgi:hypothetical protein
MLFKFTRIDDLPGQASVPVRVMEPACGTYSKTEMTLPVCITLRSTRINYLPGRVSSVQFRGQPIQLRFSSQITSDIEVI